MPEKRKKKKTSKKQRNVPLSLPLPFDQIVDAILQTKPVKKKRAVRKKRT